MVSEKGNVSDRKIYLKKQLLLKLKRPMAPASLRPESCQRWFSGEILESLVVSLIVLD